MSHTNGSLALNGNGHRPYTNGNGHRPYAYNSTWRDKIVTWWAGDFKYIVMGILFWAGMIFGLPFTLGHLAQGDRNSSPVTSEEKIKADRLHKIDAAIEVLQDERDEIEPPIEYEPDPPGWP
jgi:hypothetical protein